MPAPEPQPRCGDTNPEDHAGSQVDDGFDTPARTYTFGEQGPVVREYPPGTIVRPTRG